MRTRVWGAVPLATGLVLAGCGSADEATTAAAPSTGAEVRTVEHAAGSTEIAGTPERVVVLDTGELDAVLALGVTPVGAVRTGVSDELPAYIEDAGVDPAAIENVGTIAEPALEQIAALEPDLILSNAVRHSGASACGVAITTADGALDLTVHDDGRGLDPARAPGVGLRSMRERVEELGGTFAVLSPPEGGTLVHARLPLPDVGGNGDPADPRG